MEFRTVHALSFLMVLAASASPAFGQLSQEIHPDPSGTEATRSDLSEKAAFVAVYDDGERDVSYSATDSTPTYEIVMRFDDIGGADVTLDAVEICLTQSGSDPMMRYEVVGYLPDGPGGIPGTEVFTVAAEANGIDSGPNFDTTGVGLDLTGIDDLYLGARHNPVVDPDFSFCADYDGLDGVQPAYSRFNETGAWNLFGPGGFDAANYKAMMFRAFLSTPGVVAERVLVPAFAVDTTSGVGTTTLFAVRNLTGGSTPVVIDYYDAAGNLQRSDDVTLGPRAAETVNIRDIPGLAVDPDGFARGYVTAETGNTAGAPPVLAGDYIQVDVGDNFATGERAVHSADLCDLQSVRFLSFGDGTQLAIWLANPQGPIPGIDPPSYTVQAFDEAGNPVTGVVPQYADDHLLELEAADFTGTAFGSLVFDFSGAGGGTVFAEYSAEGRFSVGVDSQCEGE
jgi:hypothetical protein